MPLKAHDAVVRVLLRSNGQSRGSEHFAFVTGRVDRLGTRSRAQRHAAGVSWMVLEHVQSLR